MFILMPFISAHRVKCSDGYESLADGTKIDYVITAFAVTIFIELVVFAVGFLIRLGIKNSVFKNYMGWLTCKEDGAEFVEKV